MFAESLICDFKDTQKYKCIKKTKIASITKVKLLLGEIYDFTIHFFSVCIIFHYLMMWEYCAVEY